MKRRMKRVISIALILVIVVGVYLWATEKNGYLSHYGLKMLNKSRATFSVNRAFLVEGFPMLHKGLGE